MAEPFTPRELSDDVRVDVFTGGGSGVRATHLETGIVVEVEATEGVWLAKQVALERLAEAVRRG